MPGGVEQLPGDSSHGKCGDIRWEIRKRKKQIDAWFTFDNSATNPFNPSSPPTRVREGWQTTDEMCLLYLTAVPYEARAARRLHRAMFASFGRPANR